MATAHINAFIVALVIVAIMGLLNYSKVYSKTIYIVLGIFLWFFIYQSGLHATLWCDYCDINSLGEKEI
jgi:NhaA family Na+:H+ antiporter